MSYTFKFLLVMNMLSIDIIFMHDDLNQHI